MAKIQNPVIGRATGQAGGMVFSKSFDKNVMRARPFQVRDAQTASQLLNRAIVTLISLFYAGFTPSFLIRLFPIAPASRSRYSELLSQLQGGRDISTDPVSIDFTLIPKLGNGYPSAATGAVGTIVGAVLTVTWDWVENAYAGAADTVSIVLFNETKSQTAIFETAVLGSVETATLVTPTGWVAGDTTTAYIGSTVNKFKPGTELSDIE